MKKIDLLKLAEQIEQKTYKDIECSFGELRVYHTPEPMIWTYRPDRPEPVQPEKFTMKTVVGPQARDIKIKDKEYQVWLSDKESYDNELSDIRLAARYVLALRDIEFPDLSQPPPLAARYLNGHYPENELLRKKVWLDHTVLAIGNDVSLIMAAMIQLAGQVDNDNVDAIKKNSESTIEEGLLVEES